MRLASVERGKGLIAKLKLLVVGLSIRDRAPDVVRVLFYRPHLFGRSFSRCLDIVLRGPSDWTIGERELFAAFVSRLNQCHF
jgi:hypothetical protein